MSACSIVAPLHGKVKGCEWMLQDVATKRKQQDFCCFLFRVQMMQAVGIL